MKTVKYKEMKTSLNSEQKEQVLDFKKKYLKSLLKPLACLVAGGLLSFPQFMYKSKSIDISNHLQHNHKLEYTLYSSSRDLYDQLSDIKKDNINDKELRIAKDNLEERTNNLITSLNAEDNLLKEATKEYILNPKITVGNPFLVMGVAFGFPMTIGSYLYLSGIGIDYFGKRRKFLCDIYKLKKEVKKRNRD